MKYEVDELNPILAESIPPALASSLWPIILGALKFLPLDKVAAWVTDHLPFDVTEAQKATILAIVNSLIKILIAFPVTKTTPELAKTTPLSVSEFNHA